ncbi:MAG: OadG family protein [Oscillospiraceae bacterium]|jgi:sodium pump decarboxylase gamma subunit|nr:OadG family protein [Oscillospiraceae bacterium]
MLLNLLSSMSDQPLAERMPEGLMLMALGMGVVFTALIVIWLVLEVVGAIFARRDAKKKQNPRPQELITAPAVPAAPKLDDRELIAVLTAAISAHTNKPAFSFRVVKFQERI